MMGWSSARMTLIMSLYSEIVTGSYGPRKWECDSEMRAFIARPGGLTAERPYPLLDPAGAKPLSEVSLCNSPTVVDDLEKQQLAPAFESDVDPACTSMANRVGQRFLGDSEHREAHRGADLGYVGRVKGTGESRPPPELTDEERQRLEQRGLLEDLWAKREEHLAQAPLDSLDLVAETREGACNILIVVQPEPQVDEQTHRRKLLTEAVVKLSSDLKPLLCTDFLGAYAEFADLLGLGEHANLELASDRRERLALLFDPATEVKRALDLNIKKMPDENS